MAVSLTTSWDTLHLSVVDESGAVVEEMDPSAIRNAVASTLSRLSAIPNESLVSLCMARGREQLMAMISLFSRGTPFCCRGPTARPVSRWRVGNGLQPAETLETLDALPLDTAYTIYTSGSTGERKRVDVPRRCIAENIEDFHTRFAMTSSDVILALTSFLFDPSMVEVLLWLRAGCRLALLRAELSACPSALGAALERIRPTVIQLCPSVLAWLPERTLRWLLSDWTSARIIVLGGEPFPLSLISSLRHPDCPARIFDIYGVTEVSCWATVQEIKSGCRIVPVGEPIAGTRIRVEDDGRLLIGGEHRRCIVDGIAEGEWTDSGDRVERIQSEDGGGWRILGREGEEVKLHGVRINVAAAAQAIESAIEGVRHARLLVYRSTYLVLFVKADRKIVYREVDSHLPAGTAIHHIEHLESVPLTSSGKTDCRALLALLDQRGLDASTSQGEEGEDEKWLAEIVTSSGLPSLDADVPLEQLGVDSATRLRIAFVMGLDHAPEYLVDGATTLRDLARRVAEGSVKRRGRKDLTTDGVKSAWEHVELPLERSKETESLPHVWPPHPMEKCVDAPPTLFTNSAGTPCVVIGSHSGLLVCLEAERGTPLWSTRLSHRIETGALASGGCIVSVSYDGTLYGLEEASGERRWLVECGSTVRAPPVGTRKRRTAADGEARLTKEEEDVVVVADYDGGVRCVVVASGAVPWCSSVHAPVRAAPSIVDGEAVVVLTLKGTATCLDLSDGSRRWRIGASGPAAVPFFASPLPLPSSSSSTVEGSPPSIVLVDVNALATLHDARTGVVLSDGCQLSGRAFTTPALLPGSGEVLVVTSDAERGGGRRRSSALWILSMSLFPLRALWPSSTVEGIAFYHTPIWIEKRASFLLASSCGGAVVLPLRPLCQGPKEGEVVQVRQLLPPGCEKLFSPPMLLEESNGTRLYVGGRDDALHCLMFDA